MSSSAEVIGAFCAGLVSGEIPADVAGTGEAGRRFAVYRNNVRAALTGALTARFPVVVRLVGADFARTMFAVFADRHRPESPLMMRYGERIPAFLETFPPVAGLPYLPDVARLELARGRAYHAADAPPLDRAALAAAADRDPEELRLALHPSVEVVASPHPVHSIWSMNQPGATPQPIANWRGEAALVARPRLAVLTEPLAPDAATFVAKLAQGAPLADAARAAADGFDPARTLARLFSAGIVIGFD